LVISLPGGISTGKELTKLSITTLELSTIFTVESLGHNLHHKIQYPNPTFILSVIRLVEKRDEGQIYVNQPLIEGRGV